MEISAALSARQVLDKFRSLESQVRRGHIHWGANACMPQRVHAYQGLHQHLLCTPGFSLPGCECAARPFMRHNCHARSGRSTARRRSSAAKCGRPPCTTRRSCCARRTCASQATPSRRRPQRRPAPRPLPARRRRPIPPPARRRLTSRRISRLRAQLVSQQERLHLLMESSHRPADTAARQGTVPPQIRHARRRRCRRWRAAGYLAAAAAASARPAAAARKICG